MPKRIGFHVVYATSEDGGFPACELNSQGPAARGWRSAGAAPHELLLRLVSVAAVHKLQLLAHHQLVPCSVEVLVSGGLTDAQGAATPCGAVYTSVGKVALAKPQPHARTRELRSAALPEPTVARFVKLRLSGPHDPAENEQVALMAVNVLGEEMEDRPETAIQARPSESYSPYDDLAFVMYVDVEIADLIRRLDRKKRDAVTDERFEYARRLKSAGAALASAGLRVGRWRLRKRLAAAKEDFELARHMRDKISDAMTAIVADEDLCRLLEEQTPDARNDSSMPREYDFSHHLAPSCRPSALSFDIPSPQPPPVNPEDDIQQRNTDYIKNEDLHINSLPQNITPRKRSVEENEVASTTIALSLKKELNDISNKKRDLPEKEVPEERRRSVHYKEELIGANLANAGITQVDSPAPLDRIESLRLEEERKVTDSPRRSITPNAANGTLVRRRNKSAGPRSTFEAYEERPVPALRHSHTNEYLRDVGREEEAGSATGSAVGSAGGHARPPHKLTEKERKHAALPILIFGYPLVEKFYSKTFLDKEEGLNRLRSELSTVSSGSCKTSPNKTARAAAILLQRPLRDKVYSVYSLAIECAKVLFMEFMPSRVCAAEVGRCLEKVLPELLRVAGDPAPRVHSTAQHTILTIADCPHVRILHVIPQQLVRAVPASMHPRTALSRLQMLEQLVNTHGISTEKNSGLTVRRLAECGAAGAQHAASSVRAAAERILLAAYHRSPRLVRAQLPPDDAVTRRNLIYRHLFQQFDRIDMEKMLSKAPDEDQSASQMEDSTMDTVSVVQSSHTGISNTSREMASSFMTSSLSGMTSMRSSYMTSRMTTSVSGSTLAPSSLGSSNASRTKSSLKSAASKRYTSAGRSPRDTAGSLGYNKLRLDSAESPTHGPRSSASAGGDKVHFVNKTGDVVYRRAQRNSEHRHSMIHYDHDQSKLNVKQRPKTVYDPTRTEFRIESPMCSPRTSRNDLRTIDSWTDSPKPSYDLRSLDSFDSKSELYKGCDSPKSSLLDRSRRQDYFREPVPDSPRASAGLRSLRLDDNTQMDESGYYSPGETRAGVRPGAISRSKSGNNVAEYCDQHFDSLEGAADESSGANTPEPLYSTQCTWCGRTVRAGGLDAHYWRRCVLLARCQHCQHVMEARALHSHLLEECPMGGNTWTRCTDCGAALRGDEGSYHARCTPADADECKCPYCLTNVSARDEPWQRHLTQCPRNPRLLRPTTE